MAKPKLDKDLKKAILSARKLVEELAKMDGNEAETRKRVDYIFEIVMGYDKFRHISSEYAVHGAGETVHCDFAIQLDHRESSKPDFLVEIKRVNIDLAPKHVRQAASYAIDIGCEWVLLTNGKEWKLYHISFAKPPQTNLIEAWNLMSDELTTLAEKFNIVGYKNIRRDGLARLWEKSNVLTANNLLKAILSEKSIMLIRQSLKKATEVTVSPEEIVGAIRRMLNEAALADMEKVRISLPEKKQRRKKTISKTKNVEEEPEAAQEEQSEKEEE